MRAWVLLLLGSSSLGAQSCPRQSPSGASISSAKLHLSGTLHYHHDWRKWFGLQLDSSMCGQTEVQLIGANDAVEHGLEVHRGCRITSYGALSLSPTGYYSLDQAQWVEQLAARPGCALKPPFADYTGSKPETDVQRYRVRFAIGRQIQPVVWDTARQRQLRPWQAYTSYQLTGEFVLYGACSEGFALSHVQGTPSGHPQQLEEQASLDPDSASARGVHRIWMSFECRREQDTAGGPP